MAGKRPGENIQRQPGRNFSAVPSAAYWALVTTQDSSQLLGLGSLYTWPLRAAQPMLPLAQHPGENWFPIRLGVRRWRRGRPANQPASRCGDKERGHSVSLPRPAYPLESSSGSADTFQRGHPAIQFYRIAIDAAQPDTTGRPSMTRRTHSIYQVVKSPSTEARRIPLTKFHHR